MDRSYELEENEDLITKFEYINRMPGYFIVKDFNLKYQSISTDFVRLGGGGNVNKAIGKTVREIPSKFSECAEAIINLDKKVVTTNQKVIAIDVFDFGFESMIFLCQKRPLENKKGEVSGIYINSIDITSFISNKYYLLKSIR